MLSCIWLFVTPWIVVVKAPLSTGLSRQEYWSGLPLLSPRGSYWPRDWTYVSYISCTGRQVFYHSAAWEALIDSCVRAKSPQSCLTLCDLWTLACQALSVGFSGQEYWSGFLCPPPADLPDPGFKPAFLNVSCIGRQVLHQQSHLGSPADWYFRDKLIKGGWLY